MGKRAKATAISLLFLFAIIYPSGCGSQTGENETTDILKPAPDFDLEKFGGGRAKLSDYRGKVVILDFWATWCGPCRIGIPDFVELEKKYGDQGLAILGINLDQNPKQVLPAFIEKYKINYPILLTDSRVEKAYGDITGIPTIFVIDQRGKIFKQYVGFRPKPVFEGDIKALLNQ